MNESIQETSASETPRVSVVIAAYKMAETLEHAVRSTLEQTERDLEILIIDDCSPDATLEVAHRLAATDARIRVLRTPENGGRAKALNYGTDQARGRWMAFLDADDWMAPTRIQKLADAGDAAGVEMASDNQVLVDWQAKLYVGTAMPGGFGSRILTLDDFLEASDPTANFDFGMLKQLYRRDFIVAYAIRYLDWARTAEDFYGLLDFFAAGGRAVLIDEPLYYYVQPYGTVSGQGSHGERTRYRFEIYRDVHRHYMDALEAKLSPRNRQRMIARGQGIEALIHFHQARECARAKDFAGALRRIVTAPWCFWPMMAGRVHRKFLGPKLDVARLQKMQDGAWYDAG